MNTNRLEAFSDGVLAIIITIMVLELKAPESLSLEVVKPVLPVFMGYMLSFIYVGIFWINHHHLFQVTEKVTAKVLWANLHLLFWLSLIPFATEWIGENHLDPVPLIAYGGILVLSTGAFSVLRRTILSKHSDSARLRKLLGSRLKERVSFMVYLVGMSVSFIAPWLSVFCYVIVALAWIIPNKEIETFYDINAKKS